MAPVPGRPVSGTTGLESLTFKSVEDPRLRLSALVVGHKKCPAFSVCLLK